MTKISLTTCHAVLVAILTLAVGATTARSQEPTRTVDLGGGVKMEFVRIEPGSFSQGSPANEPLRGTDENQRQVTISQAYYLAETPVTRGQFARFVTATGYRTEAEKGNSGGFGLEKGALVQKKEYQWRNPGFSQTDDHPVVIVTWDDATAFLKWVSQQAHQECHLPSEAEWEYACRAGTTSPFYSGDSEADAAKIAWFNHTAGDGTRPVGGKEPNDWGLFDMTGNVWEWCRDWYGPYASGPATDPMETRSNLSDKPRRVLRGGSFLKDVKNCRSAARFRSDPGSRNADTGFRVMFRVTALATPVESPVQAQPRPQTSSPPVVTPPVTAPVTPPVTAQPPSHLPQERHATQPPPPVAVGGRPIWLGLLCPCGLLLAGAAVLIFIFVLWRGNRSSASEPPDIPTGTATPPAPRGSGAPRPQPRRPPRVVDDGFWLEDPVYSAGSTVRYSYVSGGKRSQGEFTVGPGHQGHFVYTGVKPSDIQILAVIPGAAPRHDEPPDDLYRNTGTFIGMQDVLHPDLPLTPPPPPPPPPPARSSFPPAY